MGAVSLVIAIQLAIISLLPKEEGKLWLRGQKSNLLMASPTETQNLSTEKRLHYSWEFRRFFNQSQVIKLHECTIFRIENGLSHFRIGITLKARGMSVDRNRVKRQIRESFRILGSSLGSFDYNVVIPGHKKLGYPYPNRLGKCLRDQLIRAIAAK